MSLTTTTKVTPGVAEFEAILQGQGQGTAPPSSGLRREAALLAFARRCSAQPRPEALALDCGTLLMAVLEADRYMTAESTGPHTISLTVRASEESGRLDRPVVYRGPVEPASSMAAYAMQSAAPVMSENLAREPRFTDLYLRRAEAVSALVVPLMAGERVYGALGVCQSQPRWFSDEDLRFTELMGHLLTTALVRTSLEEEGRRERSATKAIWEASEGYVLYLDPEGNVLEGNRAFWEALELTAPDLAGRSFATAVVAPEEAATVHEILLKAAGERKACEFECRLLSRVGMLRPTTWALRVVCDLAAKPRLLVLAGVDRTVQLRLEEDLQKARLVAEKATAALNELQSQIEQATSDISGEAPATALVEPPLLEAVPPNRTSSGRDLRTSPRRSFQYRQRIAPVVNKRLPAKRDFYEVQCRDISAGGISFLLDERPDFANLVVALGSPPLESFFGARIVRIVEARDPEGVMRYLVGCRFTGRVHL